MSCKVKTEDIYQFLPLLSNSNNTAVREDNGYVVQMQIRPTL